MILDISDATIICYRQPRWMRKMRAILPERSPDDDDDDNDDDDVDKDIQQTATEIGTKSDDSGFHGSGVGSISIESNCQIL